MKLEFFGTGWALRLSAAVIALSLSAAAQISFSAPVSYPCEKDPHDVTVGDFDADGDVDLVATLHSPPRLCVLRNNGEGTYGGPEFMDLAAGIVPQGILAPDFDADGLPDLAIVSSATGQLIILHNLGDAHFAQIAEIDIGVGPTELAVADVDGDHDLDIAVSNTLGNTVAIVHNLGSGNFSLVQEVAVGVGPKALDFGWFYDLPVPDLAVAVHDAHAVYVLINDGSGRFAEREILPVPGGRFPECVEVADFDEDGNDDFAVTFSSGLVNKFAIYYQLNTGPTDPYTYFSDPVSFNVGALHPSHIVAGDFDLDRRIDVAVVSSNSNALSILRNLGEHKFGFQAMVLLPGPQSDHLLAEDLDGDRLLDLVCTNGGGNGLSVILNALPNPSNYCFSVPNSTGDGARIEMVGSPSIAANEFTLRVTNAPPNRLGLFLCAWKPAQTPFQGSFLCLEAPIARLLPAAMINGRGVASYYLPIASEGPPAPGWMHVLPGSVWNFQFLYRDTRDVNWPLTNLSDGLRVIFEP